MAPDDGDWNENRRMVLAALTRIENAADALRVELATLRASEIADLRAELSAIKATATGLGALAGAAMTALFRYVFK